LDLLLTENWTTDGGEKREDVEFHKIVAWNKLGELCSQLLTKGRKVYVEGRISNRSWTGQDGVQRNTTEIVIEDMIILDNKRAGTEGADDGNEPHMAEPSQEEAEAKPAKAKSSSAKAAEDKEIVSEDVNPMIYHFKKFTISNF